LFASPPPAKPAPECPATSITGSKESNYQGKGEAAKDGGAKVKMHFNPLEWFASFPNSG
jgi:hypothetical protein